MKKILVFLVAVSLLIIVLIGCQKMDQSAKIVDNAANNTNQESASNKSLPDKLSNPDVSVIVWGDESLAQFVEPAKIFEQKYGGKVSYIQVPHINDTQEKLIATISAGDAPDVAGWNQVHMPKYAIKGLLQPIDDYFDLKDALWSDVISIMEQFKYKGKYYGVARGGSPILLYFNKTMFENNGLKTPLEYFQEGKWNWENLRKVAIELTQDIDRDGLVDQYGFYSSPDYFLLADGAGFAGWLSDGNIVLTVRDPKLIEVAQFYRDACYKDKFIGHDTAQRAQTAFVEGKLAMFAGQTSLAGTKFVKEDMKMQWDIAPFPAGPNGSPNATPGTCGFWGIPTGAKNPQGAAVLLYLRQRYEKEENEDVVFTEEQKKMIAELKPHIIINRYSGIGALQKAVNKFWTDVRKGVPVITAIDQHSPIFQEEINLSLQDAVVGK